MVQALEQGPELSSDEDDGAADRQAQHAAKVPVYDEEQQALKHNFMQAVDQAGAGGAAEDEFGAGVLQKRAKPSVDVDSIPVDQQKLQQVGITATHYSGSTAVHWSMVMRDCHSPPFCLSCLAHAHGRCLYGG